MDTEIHTEAYDKIEQHQMDESIFRNRHETIYVTLVVWTTSDLKISNEYSTLTFVSKRSGTISRHSSTASIDPFNYAENANEVTDKNYLSLLFWTMPNFIEFFVVLKTFSTSVKRWRAVRPWGHDAFM